MPADIEAAKAGAAEVVAKPSSLSARCELDDWRINLIEVCSVRVVVS